MEKFTINCYLSGKQYDLTVEHIYSSSQVLRFKIVLKVRDLQREIYLQKVLIRKSNQWKIFKGLAKSEDVVNMGKAIDSQLNKIPGKERNKTWR